MRTVIAIVLAVLIIGTCARSNEPAAPAVTAPSYVVEYSIAEQWSIPNGGYGKAVLIDPANANVDDLTALGERIKYDTRADRNAFVFVFSDPHAVELRSRLGDDDLPAAELAFYDEHFVASYHRNINTGSHALVIMLGGPDVEPIEIEY